MPRSEDHYDSLDRKVDSLRLFRSFENSKEARKVIDEVFDRTTMMAIYKLMTEGIVDSVDFPVSTGKEGNVFRITTPEGDFLAMKIYRTSTNTFKNIQRYIEGDPRFKGVKGNTRKVIYAWATKEFKNLCRMEQAFVRVPEPIKFYRNIILMEYLGDERMAAPQLRNVRLEEPDKVYREILRFMKYMYQRAELVHGDLSEYNILFHEGRPYIIDCGQSMTADHPNALEFLKRDVVNVNRYFRSLDVKVRDDAVAMRYIQGVKR